MIEISPTAPKGSELTPVIVISGGRGNTTDKTEVHIAIRRGNHIDPLGWYPLADLVIAAHSSGAVGRVIDQVRLVEPAEGGGAA